MTPDFHAFLARMERGRRRRAATGVAYEVDRQGSITVPPGAPGTGAPLRLLALLLLGGLAFKAVLFALLGEEAYTSRVARLAQGGLVERASAWVMQADPATLGVAGVLDELGG